MQTMDDGYLVCENGRIAGVFSALPAQYAALPLLDYTGKLILPGMTDLHVHAPQFAFRGLGMDLELLEWLNTYTFPEESKYADLEYADRAYTSFVDHLRRSTTTRAAIFATIHVPATRLLMEKLEASGLVTYVGKVNMNRNCPPYLRELSTNHSLRDTERWILDTKDAFQRTKPILTPRFIPSCTDDLMFGLARLREQYDLPVQSHLSENYSEIDWIRELCPKSKFYGDAYDQFGLFGMALFVNYMDFGDSILAGSLTLGLLSLPLVIRTTEEALKAIPDSMREGSRALGATKLQTIWHVILPMGMPNIITGLILALGRVSGETAPILFTCAAYFLPHLPTGIFDQCMALPYHLYVISTSGTDMEAQLPIAYGTALVLILIIFLVNLLAHALRKYFEKKIKTN